MATGEVLGHPKDYDHLFNAPYVSNLIITGDYFRAAEKDVDVTPNTQMVEEEKNKSH